MVRCEDGGDAETEPGAVFIYTWFLETKISVTRIQTLQVSLRMCRKMPYSGTLRY